MNQSESNFNASITVTELLIKTLENNAKDLASRCIKELCKKHNLNETDEIRELGLENLSLIRKAMTKKSSSNSNNSEKKEKKVKKESFVMPFICECLDKNGCQGLAYNRGLFTQCDKKRMENGSFCKGCQSQADKNASGNPDCGTVSERLNSGLYEFKDSKGRHPVSYLKVLKKLNLTRENAEAAAGKINIVIPENHFEVKEKKSKKSSSNGVRGRPKKSANVIQAENVTDLFQQLTSEATSEVIEVIEEKPVKKGKLSDEEKALKKAQLEAERAKKKEEREAKREAEKKEREAEREAKREAEKKVSKKEKKAEKVVVVEEEQEKVTVTRMQINGKNYLKSSTNILYNPESKEEVGLWDPETKTIKDLPEEDEEEAESDYEE